ncbi:hypothetical protein BHE74_00039238 [Ensete ventricosum]|nr:hypothetical protein GW17_00016616 [Ensete ventricosum]RWW54185.1 hypothetical protein BHE74_00039238 [Ensete ventricosum]
MDGGTESKLIGLGSFPLFSSSSRRAAPAVSNLCRRSSARNWCHRSGMEQRLLRRLKASILRLRCRSPSGLALSKRKRETCVAFEPQIGDQFDLASVKEIDGIMRIAVAVVVVLLAATAEAGDQNDVFTPCDDAKIQRWDGFTFGIAFSNHDSFFSDGVQLSPCDSRLSLTSVAQLAVFRPKVDEISLLTVDTSANPAVWL